MSFNNYIFNFCTKKYKFRKIFEKSFGNFEEWNNKFFSTHKSDIIRVGHDIIRSEAFQKYYNTLIGELPLDFNKRIYFQKNPTFRIGYPEERTTSFHTDNISSGHGDNIINFWFPLSKINIYNTLWLVSAKETKSLINSFKEQQFSIETLDLMAKEYAKPCNIQYGKFIKFSNKNLHGTTFNKSNEVRISFDFRILNGDKNAGIKFLDNAFTPFEDYEIKKPKDVISVAFTNHKVKHISHEVQRTVINEYCKRKNFRPHTESAEWYNLKHYPILNDLTKQNSKMPIVIFSKNCFDLSLNITKDLFNNLKKYKAKVYFALEDEML